MVANSIEVWYLNVMTTTQVDVYLRFPADEWTAMQFDELAKCCGGVDYIEQSFGIEVSCGEGKYIEDFYQWSENEQALFYTVTDEELERLDGCVCLQSPPRFQETKEPLKLNKDYRFTVKYNDRTEEAIFYLNSREASRRWVG